MNKGGRDAECKAALCRGEGVKAPTNVVATTDVLSIVVVVDACPFWLGREA